MRSGMEIKRENSPNEFLVYMKIIKTEDFDRNVQSDCILVMLNHI